MTRRTWVLPALLLSLSLSLAQAAVVPFTDSYLGTDGGAACDNAFDIVGAALDDGLQHPVFIYTVGTNETFDNAEARAAVAAMAAKGFVAATVAYDTSTFGNCALIAQKAACMFRRNSASSAIARLCARGDCRRGVVTGGFSQGAILALLARNYDGRVAAAWGMGLVNRYGPYDLKACVNNGKRKLASTRLRIVNGERDVFGGSTAAGVRGASVAIAGKACGATAYSCLNANGSGWLMIRNAEVSDRSADHCFYRKARDCNGSQNILDAKWKSGRKPWALPAS
ncbi:MAG: hypothetical protein AB7P42_21395, partial [Gammaproteobacteria bacterium]